MQLDMEFEQLPDSARALWAKSGEAQGHGLLAHMLDVAAVAETLLYRESEQTLQWAAQTFGLPLPSTPRWLAAMAGLHDFGKGLPGFQAKWPQGRALDEVAGLPFSAVSLAVARHDLATAALLRRVFSARFPEAAWIASITQALAAHHRYMPSSREIADGRPRHEGRGWLEAREARSPRPCGWRDSVCRSAMERCGGTRPVASPCPPIPGTVVRRTVVPPARRLVPPRPSVKGRFGGAGLERLPGASQRQTQDSPLG
jgi:CRISPR-associated endonuclease Cas3-HD